MFRACWNILLRFETGFSLEAGRWAVCRTAHLLPSEVLRGSERSSIPQQAGAAPLPCGIPAGELAVTVLPACHCVSKTLLLSNSVLQLGVALRRRQQQPGVVSSGWRECWPREEQACWSTGEWWPVPAYRWHHLQKHC